MTDPPRGDAHDPESRLDNGLRATYYVPLTDVAPEVGQHLLTALGRARIAAYLSAPTGTVGAPADGPPAPQRRLFVASDERGDARTIVAAAVKALGAQEPQLPAALPDPPADPLAGKDADALFDELVADWHVDTHAAIREAERDLRREDADWRARLSKPPADDPVWLDEDHYVPPPPPPLPRLAGPTIIGMALLAISIIVLGLGGQFGLAGNLTLVLGICGILLAGVIFVSRLRDHRRDDDDDGAAL